MVAHGEALVIVISDAPCELLMIGPVKQLLRGVLLSISI